jgi:hypothetical protein
MDDIWKLLPNNILYYHILPKLSIDIKLAFNVKPNQISKKTIFDFEIMFNNILKPSIYYYCFGVNNFEYLSICKFCNISLSMYQLFRHIDNDKILYNENLLIYNVLNQNEYSLLIHNEYNAFWKYDSVNNKWLKTS